jgi:cellulose synthase/poly-beta-1,6-N-acetylglucosamine synthase-like glycosyltransferase
MTLPVKNKFQLLAIFYKSTLTLSIGSSVLLATLAPKLLIAFSLLFVSAGTIVTLLYKEMSRQHEYYFYYNKSLTKPQLILTCITGNLIIGVTLFIIALNA